jgi:predicted pyridoxine 5'-phosphate oxidase superfamily flavin-nucleotide-binding protein
MNVDDHPGRLYGDGARSLQDAFDSRRLADALSSFTVHEELTDDDVMLIERQSTVWIGTVDDDGWPDVSYKGGTVGFVTVASPRELRIPFYDGNGMWRTLGNVTDNGRVALLFIDTDRPWRMRLHGRGRVSVEAADLERHVGAQAVLVVAVGRIFPNCGRYIHRDGSISKFVPQPDHEVPIPDWKRFEPLRPLLPARDQQLLDHDAGVADGTDGSAGYQP